MATRLQKRWSGRLRMAGALLLLAGSVGLIDRLLPGGREAAWPGWGQPVAAASLIVVGFFFYVLGGRWR